MSTIIRDEYYSGSDKLSSLNLRALVKGNENYLGSGAFGDVYSLRDREGNTNTKYAVKILRRNFISKLHDAVNNFLQRNLIDKIVRNPSGRLMTIDIAFATEVKALKQLKGLGIGPEIVYANFTKYYYIVERMDRTLREMIVDDSLSRAQILQLLALSDRYITSKFKHDDMHVNNIMWSNELNDFRIIDWGISLFVDPALQEELHQQKVDNLFHKNIMFIIMCYTMYKIQVGDESEREKWSVIQVKLSDYIKQKFPGKKFPGKINEYDIFSPDYKYKKRVENAINYLISLKKPPGAHGAVTFMDKIRREMGAMTSRKGGEPTRKHRSLDFYNVNKLHNIMNDCRKNYTAKYRKRDSPAYPANKCKDKKKKGNDGKMYHSVPSKNGVYRWVKVASNTTRKSTKPKKVSLADLKYIATKHKVTTSGSKVDLANKLKVLRGHVMNKTDLKKVNEVLGLSPK